MTESKSSVAQEHVLEEEQEIIELTADEAALVGGSGFSPVSNVLQ